MQISDAESVVMQALWRSSPLAAEDVFAAVAAGQGWQEPTVKTLLNRLLKKGAISAERDGRRFLYSPVLSREQWLAQESQGLVDRLFGGRVAPMVAQFTERGRLSKKDLAELRQLLEDIEDEP
ncbi:BlaI family transcriptional regulator [Arenimonas soli]|uniref:BlaI family transcriptional regulator n=1 Tax=Arenimonas soli TaxID=2269504 RepID=A0ABQ1HB65_9GAMM|nr:BlaI/MecI/CopY family transcriptional regulator [Arenimonas soli]GGA67394.1 BlaI family transcriptional regulator [Arenimonas soli]